MNGKKEGPVTLLFGQIRRAVYSISVVALSLSTVFLAGCDSSGSLAASRRKAVEKNLLKAVVFEGQAPETMKLAERMVYYRVPGVSLAVLDAWAVEWAEGYGVIRAGTEDPVTPETLFQAAALSQVVASLGVLNLIDEGRIELDGDVNRFLSSWKVPDSPLTASSPVTVRRLLSHSAGLVDLVYEGVPADEALPSLAAILSGEDPAPGPVYVSVPPGEKTVYSDADFAVLQQLIQDVSARPAEDFLSESVLRPLDMNKSSFAPRPPEELWLSASFGHDTQGNPLEGRGLRYPASVVSGLWTTPSDLGLYLVSLMKAARGVEPSAIPAGLARAMMTPQILNRGLGFIVEGEGDELLCWLRGRIAGFEGALAIYPAHGRGAVILTNSDNGYYLIDEILRSLSSVYGWPHFRPEVKKYLRLPGGSYEAFVGRYEVTADYLLEVSHEDYYLVIQPTGQAPTKFYVENSMTFFSTDPHIVIWFIKNAEGRVTGLELRQRDFTLKARKIE